VSSWIHEWLSGWAATPDVTLDLVAGVAIANGEELTAFAVVEASGSEAWGSVRRRQDAALQLDAGDVLANGEDVTVSGDAVLSSEAQSAAARATVVSIFGDAVLSICDGRAVAPSCELEAVGDAVLDFNAGDTTAEPGMANVTGEHRISLFIVAGATNVVPFRVKGAAQQVKQWRVK
jgi:predicted secreted hydrolase